VGWGVRCWPCLESLVVTGFVRLIGSMGNSMTAGVTSVFIAALFEARGHTDRSAQANFTSNRSFWDFRTESCPAMGIVIIKSSVVFLAGSLVAILVDVERPHLSSLF
jgi:hypothetical protein